MNNHAFRVDIVVYFAVNIMNGAETKEHQNMLLSMLKSNKVY